MVVNGDTTGERGAGENAKIDNSYGGMVYERKSLSLVAGSKVEFGHLSVTWFHLWLVFGGIVIIRCWIDTRHGRRPKADIQSQSEFFSKKTRFSSFIRQEKHNPSLTIFTLHI